MYRTLVIAANLSLTFALAGMAQSTTQTASLAPQIFPREAQSLIKSASSAADFKVLAGYYHQKEAKYRAEAADEKAERDRRAQVNASVMQKYPRPVDSAQYLYESYTNSADHAALQAQHFEQLASAQTQHSQQLAASPAAVKPE
jgi:hypothetical protein